MVLFLQTSPGVLSCSASSFTLRLLYNDSPSEYDTLLYGANCPALETNRMRNLGTKILNLNSLKPTFIDRIFETNPSFCVE